MIVMLAIAGCKDKSNQYVAPPPPAVTVSQPVERDLRDFWEFTGTTAAIESVEVRARVKGFIDKVNFEPDSLVKAGQMLYTIDPRPFKAQLEQVTADVDRKQAALDLAQVNYDRIKSMFDKQAASDLEVRQYKANFDMAKADLSLAKAQLDTAQLDLDWSQVRAPIDGRISRNLVDQGALVGADGPTLLATVRNDTRIYVYFNASETDVLEFLRMHPKAREQSAAEREAGRTVYMGLSDEDGYPREGQIESADNAIDANTGTLLLRAVFDNPDRRISPGMFARVRIPRTEGRSLLVPDLAVAFDQRGNYVLVVDAQNKVDRRDVTVGPVVEGFRRIESGLSTDDWVVVNGLQRARPGAAVSPEKKPMEVVLPPSSLAPDVPARTQTPAATPADNPASPDTTDQPAAPADPR